MGVRNRGNAEHYVWGEGCDGWRLLNRADLSVIHERIPPGLGEVLHYHNLARQVFYVLQGQLEIDFEGEKVLLAHGDSLEIPPTQHHSVSNAADKDVHFLVISSPSTANDRINIGQ
jgi:mannose-6-phosphate isomerase-like protein (cupin superfamily)